MRLVGTSWRAGPSAKSSSPPTGKLKLSQCRTSFSTDLTRQMAKQSALNGKVVKIEKVCSSCLLRTLGNSNTCRGCQSNLANYMKILPGQWPPLNCPAHPCRTLWLHCCSCCGPTRRPHGVGGSGRQHVLLAHLRQEKLKLEKHILELPNDGFAALREQLEATLPRRNPAAQGPWRVTRRPPELAPLPRNIFSRPRMHSLGPNTLFRQPGTTNSRRVRM